MPISNFPGFSSFSAGWESNLYIFLAIRVIGVARSIISHRGFSFSDENVIRHITPARQGYKGLRSFTIFLQVSPQLTPVFSMSSVISSLLGIYPYYKLAALFFIVMLFRQLKKGGDASGNPNSLPLPPGPKGYPVIGNLFDMPVDKPWVVYDEWRKTYGNFHNRWFCHRK